MTTTPVALITGASQGLGRAVARSLAQRNWRVIVDGRDPRRLAALASELPSAVAIRGSVTDPTHRSALAAAVAVFGRLDLLMNNASDLGPSPLPKLADYSLDAIRAVYETNVIAPLGLIQLLLPMLRASGGSVLDVSSDAAVEAYPGWGGYGSTKAALDQLSAVLAVEEQAVHVYAVDPGDMRTAMHQAAYPGEDISDRPTPEAVVPAMLRMLAARPASGRYRASEWAAVEVTR